MKYLFVLYCFIITLISNCQISQNSGIAITEVSSLIEAVSNNAVAEGWANDTGYVYSFGGIDTTKMWSGIHLRSFRYNTVTDIWDTIPPLPDTLGKIAAGASWVDSIIYIIGGYHVYSNGNEVSSDRVHRYDPRTNTYLSDGAPIPVPIDDHVQAVWNDSLIYVITGWSNTGNVPDVQIYDPTNNQWLTGTPLPNNSYQVFGASGIIIGNTIYYHGGALYGFNFPGQSTLRIGQINPNDPTQVTWSNQSSNYISYRSASTYSVLGEAIWLGGSEVTYNYNGIAYNGSGGVSVRPNNLIYFGTSVDTIQTFGGLLPIDLRGVANFNNGNPRTSYIAGGMIANQKVSNKTYKIDITSLVGINENHENNFLIFPNPSTSQINLTFETHENRTIQLFDLLSKELLNIKSNNLYEQLDVSNYPKGVYLIKVASEEGSSSQKIIIQ